ncbi:DUF1453 domain-containing protein [Streptomyces sp. TG1A-8]|uniref:DUF1453 domain-containing protein n=1 Tax=Streptomyces sp. TG1A-8 TaxID=3051385 RepID=UPI00265BBDD7|nr:DUF1453 domain-containing protein [Streptomyces sp. TG1A-8]MDO0925375.1 DUF1453 domain-containing protein [Streptomyces sp. TG1A-8]
MSGLVNALVIAAVAAVVIVHRFRARPVGTDRRWWLLPAVLAVTALREPGVLDAHHRTESAALLAVEILIGLVTGAGWAWTSLVWTEPDGVVWTRSSRASGIVWAVGIALRAAVFALGSVTGVRQDGSALTLGLAGTLLVRAGILARRAQSPGTGSRPVPAAYGDAARPAPAWKERV